MDPGQPYLHKVLGSKMLASVAQRPTWITPISHYCLPLNVHLPLKKFKEHGPNVARDKKNSISISHFRSLTLKSHKSPDKALKSKRRNFCFDMSIFYHIFVKVTLVEIPISLYGILRSKK